MRGSVAVGCGAVGYVAVRRGAVRCGAVRCGAVRWATQRASLFGVLAWRGRAEDEGARLLRLLQPPGKGGVRLRSWPLRSMLASPLQGHPRRERRVALRAALLLGACQPRCEPLGDPAIRAVLHCSRPPIWPAAGEPRLSRHRGRVPHVVDERDDLGAVDRLVLQVDEHLGHLGLPEEEIASGTPRCRSRGTPRRRVRGGHLGLLALRSRQPLVLGRVVELGPVRRVRLVAPAAVLALGTAGRARVHEELDAKTRGGRVLFANLHEELDTHHKSLGTHKQSTPRAGEGLPAGAARLGRAALQNHLFELQEAVVDVEGVCNLHISGR
jgi:hypothetical protein